MSEAASRPSRGSRVKGRGPERCLRFGGAVAMVVALVASTALNASELRWRSDSVTKSETTSLRTQSQSQSQNQSPSSKSTGSSTSLRFVRPGTPSSGSTASTSRREDANIRQAAFEDDAPKLTSGREAETQTRSVVVNRDDANDSFRSAQRPAGNTNSQPGTSSNSTQAEQPQFPMPPLEPMPETNFNLPAPQNAAPSSEDRQLTQPPAEQPPAPGVGAGQFQPVLPAGPNAPDVSGPPAPAIPAATIEAEKSKAKESCNKSFENLRAYTVDKVNLNIAVKGTEGQDFPFECSIDDGAAFSGRCWEQTTYMWKASAMCHKPLYFEDEQLERYGHSFTPCFQPFISGAHFFCTLPVLPYCMGVEPPCECIYALGHYRPGSCAPYMCNPIPLSPRGALLEAGVVTGAAAALP